MSVDEMTDERFEQLRAGIRALQLRLHQSHSTNASIMGCDYKSCMQERTCVVGLLELVDQLEREQRIDRVHLGGG